LITSELSLHLISPLFLFLLLPSKFCTFAGSAAAAAATDFVHPAKA